MNEVGEIVERRGVAIDDGEQRAGALRDDSKTRRGQMVLSPRLVADGQRRAICDYGLTRDNVRSD